MKQTPIATVLAIGACLANPARGQGFVNLDFESAQNLPSNAGPGVLVTVTNALAGWSASTGPNSLSYVSYITNYLDRGSILELDGGNASIKQTALVPRGSESLQFWVHGNGAAVRRLSNRSLGRGWLSGNSAVKTRYVRLARGITMWYISCYDDRENIQEWSQSGD